MPSGSSLASLALQQAWARQLNTQQRASLLFAPSIDAEALTLAPPPPRAGNTNRNSQTYGYHNTFHFHAQPTATGSPPSYDRATSTSKGLQSRAVTSSCARDVLPEYSCSVHQEGIVGVKFEFSSPFVTCPESRWHDVYAVLSGTKLHLHRLKTRKCILRRARRPTAGRVLKTYSLQHAEVGLATDVKELELIPKSALAKLIPMSARQRVYETDPHVFKTVREYVIRLRAEGEQILLCARSQEEMLDWVEKLCAAIDISHPLEDRSEPRYRSLPRRNRRGQNNTARNNLSNLESLTEGASGRRLLREQERIIQRMYPHLWGNADTSEETGNAATSTTNLETTGTRDEDENTPLLSPQPSSFTNLSSLSEFAPASQIADNIPIPNNPKFALTPQLTPSAQLRYRRRCAPVLLASSPRSSDVILINGVRMRIDHKRKTLLDFELLPPKYDAHGFHK
ncbi:hypothetical protein K402DRAFT_321780, partial [Aulographum hederae CBS 113979]